MFGITLSLAYLDELLHFCFGIVGDPELPEFPLLNAVIHGPRCILKGRLTIRYMEIHCLYRRSLESIQRCRNTLLNLARFMGPGWAVSHLRVDGEPRGGPNLPEPFLRAWIVAARIDLPVAMGIECIQQSRDIFVTIEVYNSGILDGIADLL